MIHAFHLQNHGVSLKCPPIKTAQSILSAHAHHWPTVYQVATPILNQYMVGFSRFWEPFIRLETLIFFINQITDPWKIGSTTSLNYKRNISWLKNIFINNKNVIPWPPLGNAKKPHSNGLESHPLSHWGASMRWRESSTIGCYLCVCVWVWVGWLGCSIKTQNRCLSNLKPSNLEYPSASVHHISTSLTKCQGIWERKCDYMELRNLRQFVGLFPEVGGWKNTN